MNRLHRQRIQHGTEHWEPLLREATEYDPDQWKEWYADYGVCINSGKYDGKTYEAAVDAIAADLKAKGLGNKQVMWRLRDWGISRQRYWGCPIPIIHCAACGDVPVPDKDLPVVLPEDCVPDGSGNPLKKRADFVNCTCPKCGKDAERETDTMDTFVDSSWYYARFASGRSANASALVPDGALPRPSMDSSALVPNGALPRPSLGSMVDAETNYWMPVDQYIGGIEHAILHLLYARFFHKLMRDEGMAVTDEPFTRLLSQGMVLAETFFRVHADGRKDYFFPTEVAIERDAKGRTVAATLKADGQPVTMGGIETMSKSKNNGVDPTDLIGKYGADTARLFTMFAAPPEQTLEWSDAGAEGAYRFLKRLWSFCYKNESSSRVPRVTLVPVADWSVEDPGLRNARSEIHRLLQQTTHDYGRMQFNTVASAGMKMLNILEGVVAGPAGHAKIQLMNEGVSILLRIIYPIVPHITSKLWHELGFEEVMGNIINAPWPQVDKAALERSEIEMVLQVNGKLRGRVNVPANASQEEVQAIALADENVVRHMDGKPIRKVIVVPGKLVNIVV